MEHEFTYIYANRCWDGGGSGSGSRADATVPYRALVQSLLRSSHLRSVFDVGCGDWEFSELIDWTGKRYVGGDVVASVVDQNNRWYRKSDLEFKQMDVDVDLPREAISSDLILCKDVLQHWPSERILTFLSRLLPCRLALITNTVEISDDRGGQDVNKDVPIGGFRPLDLLIPPFNLQAVEVLRYVSGSNDIKSCLLYHGLGNFTDSR